jgi:hypothetical protein
MTEISPWAVAAILSAAAVPPYWLRGASRRRPSSQRDCTNCSAEHCQPKRVRNAFAYPSRLKAPEKSNSSPFGRVAWISEAHPGRAVTLFTLFRIA